MNIYKKYIITTIYKLYIIYMYFYFREYSVKVLENERKDKINEIKNFHLSGKAGYMNMKNGINGR